MQRRGSDRFLDTWGDFFFGYVGMDVGFTVLGRTPEGIEVCTGVCMKKRTRERNGLRAKRPTVVSEERELESDAMRLSLVRNLSDAVRTFFFFKWNYGESLFTETATEN